MAAGLRRRAADRRGRAAAAGAAAAQPAGCGGGRLRPPSQRRKAGVPLRLAVPRVAAAIGLDRPRQPATQARPVVDGAGGAGGISTAGGGRGGGGPPLAGTAWVGRDSGRERVGEDGEITG